ncbi:MAG: FCD domain-containing protein, partial [Anaerolineae bacterium]|nr:FCD domain-containing protein [Anaerolineae bacterium]
GELRSALLNAVEEMRRAAASGDYQAWRLADTGLPQSVTATCHNRRVADVVQSLDDQWFRLRAGVLALEGRMEQSNHEHEAIVKSIIEGDAEEAVHATRLHIDNVRKDLVNVMQVLMPLLQPVV